MQHSLPRTHLWQLQRSAVSYKSTLSNFYFGTNLDEAEPNHPCGINKKDRLSGEKESEDGKPLAHTVFL